MALLLELAELKSSVIFVLLWDEVVVDFAYQNLLGQYGREARRRDRRDLLPRR